ncbi:MAG: hypothetical protein WBZ31_03930 [Thiobacillus sp.]
MQSQSVSFPAATLFAKLRPAFSFHRKSASIQKIVIASGLFLTLCSTSVFAAYITDIFGNASFTTNHGNFTMLNGIGGTVGGANNVAMTWNGDAYTSSSDYTGPGGYSNVSISSTTALLSNNWTAHDIQMFVPGSYSFNTTLGGGTTEVGFLNVSVYSGMIGMHMLLDWSSYQNIDVFVLMNINSIFGSGVVRNPANASACDSGAIKNCLWDGAPVTGFAPTANQFWMLASTDGDGDSIQGIRMPNGGPLQGYSANFNFNLVPIADISDAPFATPVPEPADAWLMGSGLLVLIGLGRRRLALWPFRR